MVETFRNRWWPSPEQREVLEQLKAAQDADKSAAEFVRRFFWNSAGMWSKIMRVFDEDAPGSYFDELKSDAARLELMRKLGLVLERVKKAKENPAKESAVIPIGPFLLVRHALGKCAGRRRLVKYLAPTGGGKSKLGEYLAAECGAKIVEARSEWKKSEITFLKDVALAVGCRHFNDFSSADIKDALVTFLRDRQVVLFIDECEYFGRTATNAVKFLLNKTRIIIVIGVIKEAHDRWETYYRHEAAQLTSRTVEQITLINVEPEDAALFFPKNAFKDHAAALEMVCKYASQFGHFELVARIAEKIEARTHAEDETIRDAIWRSSRAMGKQAFICGTSKKEDFLKETTGKSLTNGHELKKLKGGL